MWIVKNKTTEAQTSMAAPLSLSYDQVKRKEKRKNRRRSNHSKMELTQEWCLVFFFNANQINFRMLHAISIQAWVYWVYAVATVLGPRVPKNKKYSSPRTSLLNYISPMKTEYRKKTKYSAKWIWEIFIGMIFKLKPRKKRMQEKKIHSKSPFLNMIFNPIHGVGRPHTLYNLFVNLLVTQGS